MKSACFALAAAFACGAAQGQDIFRTRGCVACHDLDKRKVGPSFRDIGARYKGDKSKAPEIVAKMKEGKGHPKVAGSDAELQAAVEAAVAVK